MMLTRTGTVFSLRSSSRTRITGGSTAMTCTCGSGGDTRTGTSYSPDCNPARSTQALKSRACRFGHRALGARNSTRTSLSVSPKTPRFSGNPVRFTEIGWLN